MLAGIPRFSAAFLLGSLLLTVLSNYASAGDPSASLDDHLSLAVYKSRHEMRLQQGEKIIRVYRVFLGSSPVGHKFRQGDNKTPVGSYHVVDKMVSDKFHRFIGIDYPNAHDAELAFRQGRITLREKNRIKHAVFAGIRPPADTILGGHLGIHGIGADEKFKLKLIEEMDWTNGCIAVTNAEIRELYEKLPIGTVVRIYR